MSKSIPQVATLEDLNKELDRMYRRIIKLEKNDTIVLPRSAPLNPAVSSAWHDIEGGKLQVYNGSTWDTYTKD